MLENLLILALFVFFAAVCWPYNRGTTLADVREEVAYRIGQIVRVARAGRR